MYLPVILDDQPAAPPVRDADADARVLHRAGDADRVARSNRRVIGGLDGLERLDKARGLVHNLPVREDAAGADGVAVADLPRGDADEVGHLVQQRLRAEAGLRHTEAAERARGWIVRIVGVPLDLEVFVGIRPRRVRARALEHRPAERGKRARIGHDGGLHALNDAVFVAAHREIHVEAVPLRVDEDGFLPRELHLHRNARDICQQRRVVLHGHVLLATEAAADEHILYLTVLIVDAQHRGALVHGRVRALVGREEPHAAVFERQRHAALRLEEGVLRPRGMEVLREHIF